MRVIVLGGARGFFGRTAVGRLRRLEIPCLTASRRPGGDLVIDPEDPASLRAMIRAGDLVIDAAGPFHQRSTVLIDAAIEHGFHVIDLSDSLSYSRAVQGRAAAIHAARIRVLTACSSTSTVVAALTRLAQIDRPTRIEAFLSPASRKTATAGTLGALYSSLGRPIAVLRDGQLVTATGWRERRTVSWPEPLGKRRGYAIETVDAVMLPPVWPTVRRTNLWVHVGPFGPVLAVASRIGIARALVPRLQALALEVVRRVGAARGGFMVEIADGSRTVTYSLLSASESYVIAVAPAVLACRDLLAADARGAGDGWGLIASDEHVAPDLLLRYLGDEGITIRRTVRGGRIRPDGRS